MAIIKPPLRVNVLMVRQQVRKEYRLPEVKIFYESLPSICSDFSDNFE
ncbi:MAG: hypothetical protein CM1200mP10_32120 [Candidatus Neomarinimicrobiota bacterium]|nr:MAG: hypothetical protein CM1200mP10_32120 [Candidatus Neomarinimicrobiota bacterium]